MKRRVGQQQGYTLVETMIFLAVSAAMFIIAAAFVNGQQRKTEFVQAVRQFEATMQDVANDVSTGFPNYSFAGPAICRYGPSGIDVSSATPLLPNQSRCIYVGKVVQFVPLGSVNNEIFRVYTIAGAQKDTATGKETSDLTTARPRILPGSAEEKRTGSNVEIKWVSSDGGVTRHGAIAFTTNFQTYTADDSLTSSGIYVDVSAVQGVNLGTSDTAALESRIQTAANYTPQNPSRGMRICLESGGTSQHALVDLGGDSAGRLRTSTVINSGACP